ncbi:MAG: hemerythrin family protein [Bacteroidales bacterium]|nr:hemerythrin family protein [Bacteroidales bacterium]
MEHSEVKILTNAFSIGNEKIDKEHQHIIDIYNELVHLSWSSSNSRKFAEILSKMTDYSFYHFSREEKYMQNILYPEIEKHKVYHRKYIVKVSMYNSDFFGPECPDPKDVVKFLEKWWMNHIQRADLDYERYKKANMLETDY